MGPTLQPAPPHATCGISVRAVHGLRGLLTFRFVNGDRTGPSAVVKVDLNAKGRRRTQGGQTLDAGNWVHLENLHHPHTSLRRDVCVSIFGDVWSGFSGPRGSHPFGRQTVGMAGECKASRRKAGCPRPWELQQGAASAPGSGARCPEGAQRKWERGGVI